MENIMYKPVIGVVMCRNRLKGHQTQTLQEKYLNAIVNAGGLPIALPHALAEPELLNAVVDKLDGIYLPGSPSNVQPHLYGENGDEPDADPGRDLLSMALINAALERRIPIFAICRGLQELVVATGGTLYPQLRVEARAPDGLVEAVSVNDHPFALGVQWHPEWNSSEYALSRMLFDGFITACQGHHAEKRRR